MSEDPARGEGSSPARAGEGALLVLLGTFNQIVAYFVFVAVVFLGLCVAGVFLLEDLKHPHARFRVAGYPYTPLAFVVLPSKTGHAIWV